MTVEQLVAFVASCVVAMLGFFLRSAFGNITSRLDALEKTLGELLAETRASNVIAATNTEEINRLRNRMDVLAGDLQTVKAVQARCRHCNGDL